MIPGLVVVPARILGGRRWAALAGATPHDLPLDPPERLPVGAGWGLILYGWARLFEAQQIAVRNRIAQWLASGEPNPGTGS